ncbi:MAG: glycine cleavage system protein GcvH [Desulfurococcales archaeon]|nr:glycine cleavage system protein GcvH [Desulfurococcales archaeon]
MTDRRYTDSDEWALLEDGRVRVGITDYAQKRLTDIVGVELPEVGDEVSKGDAIATLESMKATADVYAPVSGRIVEVNEDLYEEPELINKDPYGKGWIVVIEATDKGEYEELLGPEEYVESVKKRHH